MPSEPILLAALPALLALVIWAVVDGQRFLLFAVLPAMIVPTALIQPGGTQVALADLLLVVVLAGWLVAHSVGAAEGPAITGNRLLVAAALFATVNFVSIAWSDRPRDTLIFTIQLVELVVLFPLAFGYLPRSIGVIRQGLLFFVAVCFGLALWTVVVFVPDALRGDFEGTYLPGLHKNLIGSVLAAALALAYTFWLSARTFGAQVLLATASAVVAGGLFASVSRGAMLGGVIAVLVASLLLRRRRALTASLVVAATAASIGLVGPEAREARIAEGGYESTAVRGYSFPAAIDKIQESPMLGTGGGTYFDFIDELNIGLFDPNNMFLLTWAEVGILGLAALLFLLWTIGVLLYRVSSLPVEAATVGVAAGGATIAFVVHAQVDITWTRGTSALGFSMAGLMLAAERLSRTRAEPAPAGPAAPAPPDRSRELVGVP